MIPLGREPFMEGPGGGEIPFTKGSKNCPEWAAKCGGIRGSSVSSPLNPSTPPITPFKRPLRGLAAPGAGPPPQRSAKGWLNLPAKRGKIRKRP